MSRADAVLILSGGMDSVTLLHRLVKRGRQPAIISFIYGQKHRREIRYAREQAAALDCPEHQVLDLTTLQSLFSGSALVSKTLNIPALETIQTGEQPATYVANRNMIFLALAVAYAEQLNVSEVYYGAQHHDRYGYWDTTVEFVRRFNELLQLNMSNRIEILAPFVHHHKVEVLREGLSLAVDYGQTWSCYRGEEKACGACPTCVERLQAFAELGLEDPLPYELSIDLQE